MTVKTMLAPLDGSELTEDMFHNARHVIAWSGAHLKVLHLRMDPDDMVPFVFGSFSGKALKETVLQAAQSSADERAERVRAAFDEFCTESKLEVRSEPNGPSSEWAQAEMDDLLDHCRVTDLVILPRPRSKQGQAVKTLERVLLESGKPILVIPPVRRDSFARHVAICWNNSEESARAVSSILPDLGKSERVSILCSKKRLATSEMLVEHLKWHGIDAHIQIFDPGHHPVGEVLLSELDSLGADLVVTGGYSRTRATQLLFGGVTWHFLNNAGIPIWMSH